MNKACTSRELTSQEAINSMLKGISERLLSIESTVSRKLSYVSDLIYVHAETAGGETTEDIITKEIDFGTEVDFVTIRRLNDLKQMSSYQIDKIDNQGKYQITFKRYKTNPSETLYLWQPIAELTGVKVIRGSIF